MTLGPLSVLWEKLRWQQPSGCLPVQCLFPQHRYGSSDGGLTPQGPAPLVRGRDNCEPGLYWDTAWPSISSNRSSGPGKQRQRCVFTCRLLCTRTGRNHFDWELAKDKFLALLLEAWWPWWGPPCAFQTSVEMSVVSLQLQKNFCQNWNQSSRRDTMGQMSCNHFFLSVLFLKKAMTGFLREAGAG